MGTHSQPLLQNRLMDVTKLGRDEVLMARLIKMFWPYPPRGGSRARPNRSPGGGGGGGASTKNFFRPEGYSNKPNS